MRWFGKYWGAPICSAEYKTEIPDVECYMCDLSFGLEARGVLMPYAGPSNSLPCIEHENGTLEVACHLECLCEALGLTENLGLDSWAPEDLQDLKKDLEEEETRNPEVRKAKKDLDRVSAEIRAKGRRGDA